MNNYLQQATDLANKVMTGKDGRLFLQVDDVNVFLAEVNEFTATLNITNTDFQPVGSILIFGVNTGVSISLALTEAVVRDDVMLEPLINAIRNGRTPSWVFQGALERWDGQTERTTFRHCIPDSSVDLMKLTPGEIISRAWNFRVNSIPEFIKTLLVA